MKGFIEVQPKHLDSSQKRWIISSDNEMINISSISRFGRGWISLKEFSSDKPITIHVNHSYKEIIEKVINASHE